MQSCSYLSAVVRLFDSYELLNIQCPANLQQNKNKTRHNTRHDIYHIVAHLLTINQ